MNDDTSLFPPILIPDKPRLKEGDVIVVAGGETVNLVSREREARRRFNFQNKVYPLGQPLLSAFFLNLLKLAFDPLDLPYEGAGVLSTLNTSELSPPPAASVRADALRCVGDGDMPESGFRG